jgi:hypothetical protein
MISTDSFLIGSFLIGVTVFFDAMVLLVRSGVPSSESSRVISSTVEGWVLFLMLLTLAVPLLIASSVKGASVTQ